MTDLTPSTNQTRAKVRLDHLRPILASAAENGVDVNQILANVGVTGGMDAVVPGVLVDLVDYYRLQRGIGRVLDDFTSHLSKRRLSYKTGTFLVSTIQEARTLQDAILSTRDHYNMLHGDEYNSVTIRDGMLHLTINDSKFPYRFKGDELRLLVGDCLAIKTHCTLDSLTRGQAEKALHHVRLKRKRNIEDNPQNGFWNVPVKYGGAAYELVYDFEESCVSIPRVTDADLSVEGILTRVIDYLQSSNLREDSRAYRDRTLDLMLGGMVSQAVIAEKLGVSVATLRRRLTEEACTFRALLTQVTVDKADRLLARGHSVTQVSEALNYSDMRAFIRAYKKMKGHTPAAYIKSQGKAAAEQA